MREIKYQAYVKSIGECFPVEYLHIVSKEAEVRINNEPITGLYSYSKDHEEIILRQFTGLHDKNGKEIYESDIVTITGEQEFDVGHTCRMNDKAVVKWDEKECGYYLDVIKKRTVNFSDFESTSIDTFPLRQWAQEEWWIEYEVVGNVFEGGTE